MPDDPELVALVKGLWGDYKTNGTTEARYQVNPSRDGGYYFNLTSTNGQIIGTSEVYSTRSNAVRGCDSIIELLPTVELL